MKVPLLFLFVSKFTGAELNPVHIRAPSSLFFGVSGVQVSVGVMVENVREGSGE